MYFFTFIFKYHFHWQDTDILITSVMTLPPFKQHKLNIKDISKLKLILMIHKIILNFFLILFSYYTFSNKNTLLLLIKNKLDNFVKSVKDINCYYNNYYYNNCISLLKMQFYQTHEIQLIYWKRKNYKEL